VGEQRCRSASRVTLRYKNILLAPICEDSLEPLPQRFHVLAEVGSGSTGGSCTATAVEVRPLADSAAGTMWPPYAGQRQGGYAVASAWVSAAAELGHRRARSGLCRGLWETQSWSDRPKPPTPCMVSHLASSPGSVAAAQLQANTASRPPRWVLKFRTFTRPSRIAAISAKTSNTGPNE
jgi:hypothetical protein